MDEQSQIAGAAAILVAVGIQLSKIRQVVWQNADSASAGGLPARDEDSTAAVGIPMTYCGWTFVFIGLGEAGRASSWLCGWNIARRTSTTY